MKLRGAILDLAVIDTGRALGAGLVRDTGASVCQVHRGDAIAGKFDVETERLVEGFAADEAEHLHASSDLTPNPDFKAESDEVLPGSISGSC